MHILYIWIYVHKYTHEYVYTYTIDTYIHTYPYTYDSTSKAYTKIVQYLNGVITCVLFFSLHFCSSQILGLNTYHFYTGEKINTCKLRLDETSLSLAARARVLWMEDITMPNSKPVWHERLSLCWVGGPRTAGQRDADAAACHTGHPNSRPLVLLVHEFGFMCPSILKDFSPHVSITVMLPRIKKWINSLTCMSVLGEIQHSFRIQRCL